jgi:RNA polymerase sigma factor (sigma-70 family)
MTDVPDGRLLEQFARNGSEEAFAALVRRHIGLVHSVALRHTANPQQAQDITQAVFVILARKAGALGRRTVLPGWLYHTARLTAANLQRAETSRVRREQEAFMQSQLEESPHDALWRELSPQLDEAMAGLGASERDALVLRYFQNQSMAEVGKFLGLAENTAQKRVSRALEKLRRYFSKRGVSSTTAIIAGAISANSVQAAPVALAKSVTAIAVAKGAAASGSTLTLIKGALKIMAWTKMKTAMIVGVGVLLAAGTTTTFVAQHHQPVYAAGTNAVLPYKTMDDVCQAADSVDQTKLLARVFVTSKNTAVHPTDISLMIQSAVKGPIPVQIGTNGQVLNFPHERELHRENPPVVANQPKGTLNLSLAIQLETPEGLTFGCRRLGDGIAEANKLIIAQAGVLSPFAPKAQGVVFFFPKSSAGKAKIEIAPASGRREYTADANGRIKLKLDKALLAEDPEIKLSEKPQQVVPDIELAAK